MPKRRGTSEIKLAYQRTPYHEPRHTAKTNVPLWVPMPPRYASAHTLGVMLLAAEVGLVFVKRRDARRIGLSHHTRGVIKSSGNDDRGRAELVRWIRSGRVPARDSEDDDE